MAESMKWSKAAHLMVTRKQREKIGWGEGTSLESTFPVTYFLNQTPPFKNAIKLRIHQWINPIDWVRALRI
jgi:hypothetical protein